MRATGLRLGLLVALTMIAFAALGGIAVLGEVPSASFLPASALILGGVALSLRR